VPVGVVNARFAKPLDTALLREQAAGARLIVTLEDHAVAGGFGSAVLEALSEIQTPSSPAETQTRIPPVERIGWPDQYIEHGTSQKILRAAHGLSPDDIFNRVARHLRT